MLTHEYVVPLNPAKTKPYGVLSTNAKTTLCPTLACVFHISRDIFQPLVFRPQNCFLVDVDFYLDVAGDSPILLAFTSEYPIYVFRALSL